jgi:hypothetical protein
MKFIKMICVALFIFSMVACSGTENHTIEMTKPKTVDIEKALTAGVFTAVKDSSAIYVKTIKDGKVPVKGSLNLSKGSVFLKNTKGPSVVLDLDLTSWNSGLLKRDTRVTQVFFNIDSKPLVQFKVESLPQDKIQEFIKTKKLANLVLTGSIHWQGKEVKVPVDLNLSLTKYNRILVETNKPIVVKISDLGLDGVLKRLIDVCGHKSVDDAVELTVHLELE